MEASKELEEALLNLAWSLWTELGVRGVVRNHRSVAVDPEALLVLTAQLAALDPRLRDESLDCALELAPYLFMTRLKAVLRGADETSRDGFARYAATFNAAAKGHVRFPGATNAKPWRFARSGKSKVDGFSAPSQVFLRMRALFGVSARADALTIMLCTRARGWIASELGERASATKRVTTDVLRDLERSGTLAATPVANRLRYDFVRRPEAEAFVGVLPEACPPWAVILGFLASAWRLAKTAHGRSETSLLVSLQKLAVPLLESLARAGLHDSGPVLTSWVDASRWLVDCAAGVASGRSRWLNAVSGA